MEEVEEAEEEKLWNRTRSKFIQKSHSMITTQLLSSRIIVLLLPQQPCVMINMLCEMLISHMKSLMCRVVI